MLELIMKLWTSSKLMEYRYL